MASTRTVAVLARAPSSGGKSRLFAELGQPADHALLEALLLDTLDGCAGDAWTRVVVVEPPDACHALAGLLPSDVRVMPQPTGTLGARMRDTMSELFASGASAVVLLGSDLPTMSPDRIADAYAWLAAEPDALVIGPAADGGYYLLAATHVPDVFEGIAWGSATVLAETLAAARRAGIRVHLLDALEDVDAVADLRRVCAAPSPPDAGPVERAVRTRRWARAHVTGCES